MKDFSTFKPVRKKGRLEKRFRDANILFFILILVLVLSVSLSLVQSTTNDVSESYAKFYTSDAMKNFESYIGKDLNISEKISKSTALRSWCLDEDNYGKKYAAYREAMVYAVIMPDPLMYFTLDSSGHEYTLTTETQYSDFNPVSTLVPDDPRDAWYSECINSNQNYVLEIRTDKITNMERMWIHHKIKSGGKLLGVFSISLPMENVKSMLFNQNQDDLFKGYVIDRDGTIHLSGSDDSDATYQNLLEQSGEVSLNNAVAQFSVGATGYYEGGVPPSVAMLTKGSYKYASVVPITGTNWLVVTLFKSNSLFSVNMFIPLIALILSAFAIYTVIGSRFIRWLIITPIYELTSNVSEVGLGNKEFSYLERDDELGDLARTIQDAHARLNSYTDKILNTTKKMDRQGKLLHAVNEAAAVLLAASEEDFADSLLNGLKLMAQCMDVDRVYIWQNEIRDGESYYVRRFEWLSETHDSCNRTAPDAAFSYGKTMPSWEEMFKRGECINGVVSTFSEIERNHLQSYGMRSILVIPVHLLNRFWGFVSFDDCRHERAFTDDEVSILRTGSLMVANAFRRAETNVQMREADERAKLMLDATPLCCNLWDKDFNNIDCNDEAVKLFELRDKREYLDRFFELSPEYQPDGQLSSEKALGYITKAFANGRAVFNWMHRKLDDTPIPSEITLVRVKYEDGHIVAGYTRDLREYNEMMQTIDHKDKLLHTVNKVATILLQSETHEFEQNLWHCMGMMAEPVQADRVYIWKNRVKDNVLYTTQLYEWSGGAEPQQDNEFTVDIPFSDCAPGWEETLGSGHCINGIVRDMAPEAQAQLSPQGVLSILVVPVFLRDNFWGFVGFDDCHNERLFSQDEESILRSGSLLIANSMLRNEMTRDMQSAVSKLGAVLANFNGIIWSIDRNRTVTLFDGLQLKDVGTTSSVLEGKNMYTVQKLGDFSEIIEKAEKTLYTGEPQDWTATIKDKMFRAHTTPMYDEHNITTGVVGSLDDITDTVRLQSELEKALQKANAASNAKTNFLSNMSHEMRTPMNAIIGMTAIGKNAEDQKRKDYAFEKIEEASNHLLGVINDILDMSKIEANKFELSQVEFGFEKALQRTVNVISFRIDEKNQHFSVYLDHKIPRVMLGDDQRLSQVITNLLANAVKFTPQEGSIRLEARLRGEERGICTIEFRICDTGIGITNEQQSRLFRSFEQAESSTTRKFGGTGLGLAISKHIVEAMGGTIWVESEIGKGSTFAFTVRMPKVKEKSGGMLNSGINWENVRILTVDDESETREYFSEITKRFGVNCDTASNGEEALKLSVEKKGYNIYFLDWKMPGMDGVELSRRIREIHEEPSVIIMISGAEWSIIERDARDAGVNRFLSKPLFPSDIADCINDCLGVKDLKSAEDSDEDEIITFPGRKILLAEDVEINREILISLLEPWELEIDCAENGLEALQMFEAEPEKYDLIFMDVQMPEMDGLTATRKIRELSTPAALTIPIVAMTANVFREDIEKCLEAGMDSHVGKPLDFDEVMKKLKEHLL